MYLGVDLAARFSAAVMLDQNGEVHSEWDSWGKNGHEFALSVATAAEYFEAQVFIEDLPYGISNQKQVKPPIRVQGYTIAELNNRGALGRTLFLQPATWKRHFGLVMTKQTEKQKSENARLKAEEFGYAPPNLFESYSDDIPPTGPEHSKLRTEIRGKLRKAMTDYVDAFLIARYLYEVHDSDLTKIKGLQEVTL